jgi:hypothetical protein
MKYIILITIVLVLSWSRVSAREGLGEFLFDQTIGYQIGYSSSQKPIMQAIDYNGLVLFILNYGYNYHFGVDSKAFVGVGYWELFKVQYGYAFCSKNHIFRIRSDTPIFFLWNSKLWNSTYLHSLYIGVFAEMQFVDNSTNKYSGGITLGVSLMDMKLQYHERKSKKKLELWKNKKNN